MSTTEQPDPTHAAYDQHGQSVDGPQTNVAGDSHISTNQENIVTIGRDQNIQNNNITSNKTEIRLSDSRQLGFFFALVALVALIALVVIALNRTDDSAPPTFTPPAATQQPTPSLSAPTSSSRPSPTHSIPTAPLLDSPPLLLPCPEPLAANLRTDRATVIEEGIIDKDISIVGADRLVLYLTNLNVPVGLVHLLLLPDDSEFKILAILDDQCTQVDPGVQNVLQNWDVLDFTLNDQKYSIRLGYRGDSIRIIHFKLLSTSTSP